MRLEFRNCEDKIAVAMAQRVSSPAAKQTQAARSAPGVRIESTADLRLCTHWHAGGALEFTPADPGAFDGAQDCFPDAVTEHWTIDQAHR
jgi:hypothetical protein